MSSSDNLDSIVLGLVEEYLTKKTFFSINDIIEFISNRVRLNPNLNRNKIELIIKSFIKKKTIIPGTRLMKNNIIENPKRNEIYNFIKKTPSNVNDIMKSLKIGSNQALWHLSCLEKFEFVRSEKLNNHRIFFKFDSDPKLDKFYFYLNKEIIQNIVEFMSKENKPLKITEIANGMRKNHTTIKKYINILKDLKIVETEKEKNRILYKMDSKKYKNVLKSIRGS
jgi:predicted transcriptional regulator